MVCQFGLRFRLPRKSQGSLTCRCRKSATWDRRFYFLSEGRHAVDFFARKIRRLQPGSNPRSWVPEASMLTTRPPQPLLTGPEGSRRLRFPDFKTIGTWRWQGCQPCAQAAFTPRKYLWYSFLLEAESTPGPQYDRKDYTPHQNLRNKKTYAKTTLK
jgi:hypothetical protein